MILLYRLLWLMLSPVVAIWFAWRWYKGKEHPQRWREKLGFGYAQRPAGDLIWLHGASVGETISFFPLIEKLLEADENLHILVTSGTQTSAKLMAEKLPHLEHASRVRHQFGPLDNALSVGKFLQHWRPKMAVFTESEIWPEVLSQLEAKKIPAVLINARLSDRSVERYQQFGFLMRPFVSKFAAVLTQSATDQERFVGVGAQNVHIGGNLKYDAAPLLANERLLAELRSVTVGRPIIVAASTHAPEEVHLANAYKRIAEKLPKALLIIVPRHPERGAQIASEIRSAQSTLNTSLRSQGELLNSATQIYIADTLGELGTFYALADVVLMGGSFGDDLAGWGGHNPLEPLLLAKPVICGQFMHNFAQMMEDLSNVELLRKDATYHELPTLCAQSMSMGGKISNSLQRLAGASDAALRLIDKLWPVKE